MKTNYFVLILFRYELCITGDALDYLKTSHADLLRFLLPRVAVFARFAPKQKEYVVVTLKALGHTTLMCGDGTNDVGALKHADVGVAILSSPAFLNNHNSSALAEKEKEKEALQHERDMLMNTNDVLNEKNKRMRPRSDKLRDGPPRGILRHRTEKNSNSANATADKLKNLMKVSKILI